MHELRLTKDIVEIAAARASGRRVTRLRVAVGELAAVVPDALRFCFEVCAQGTVVEGAELTLEPVPGRAKCRACGSMVSLTVPYGECACGGRDLEIVSGKDVVVVEMEVE
jgi:hydrogenase nickel incorporation protein HypA/HybF